MRIVVLAAAAAVALAACGSPESSQAGAVDATVVSANNTIECPQADYRAAYVGTDGTSFITCAWRCANWNGSRRREVIARSFYSPPTWTTYFIVAQGGDCPGE